MLCVNFVSICQQPFHFLLGTAVAQLQVIQHGVVLLGKSLVCILDRLHVAAHFIGIVRHISQCHIRHRCCGLGISAQRFDQSGRKARDGFHVGIGRHARRPVRLCSSVFYGICIFLEQRIDTAQALLQIRTFSQGFLQHRSDPRRHQRVFDHAAGTAAEAAAGGFTDTAEKTLDPGCHTLHGGHHLHICSCNFTLCHGSPP